MSSQRPTSGPDRAALLREAIRLRKAAKAAAPESIGTEDGAPSTAVQLLPRRPDDVPPRLSPWQRSLWLAWQMEPNSAAYNLASAVRLSGPLETEALRRSLGQLLRRHRILRSIFRLDDTSQDEGVLQVFAPAPEPDAVPFEEHQAATGQVLVTAQTEGARPFDLEAGPLLRLLLIQDGKEFMLLLVLHHILADARSLGVLWSDLAQGYARARQGAADEPSPGDDSPDGDSPELPQYDDWAHGEARQDVDDAHLDFWRRRLTPWPEDLQLPFERRGVPPQSIATRDGWIQRPLPKETAHAVRELAARAGTTPFIVYAFLFRLLLHRLTNGRDVAFGLPVSRRQHAATASMVGYFLNTLALRHGLDEARSVQAEIERFADALRRDMGHGHVPFDGLVDALDPPRQPGRQPLFQSMFVFQERPATPSFGDVLTEPVHVDLETAKFDLTLFVTAGQDGVELAVEFRRQRFEAVWMERLLEHFSNLAAGLGATETGRPLREVPLLSAAQRAQVAAWSQGPEPQLDAEPVPLQILRQAKATPDAEAVVCGDVRWTYGRLHAVGLAIAIRLRRQGIGPRDRIGLYLDRSPLLPASILGCHWAGAAYVPLDPAYPSQRNLDVLRDAAVKAVLTRSHLVPDLPDDGPLLLDLQPLANMAPPELSTLPDPPILEDGPPFPSSLPAYLLFTSGSTGRPKGVVISHDGLRRSNGVRPQVYGQDPGRFLLLSSVAFDSSVVGIFWTLTTGGTLVLPDADAVRDPGRLATTLEDLQITSLLSVPSLYRHLLAAEGTQLASLRLVMVAGEACPPDLVRDHFRKLPETRLFNEYGPTEATVWATVHEMTADDAEASVPIGRPIPGVRVAVLDDEGRPLPAGIPGQGWISGPTLADGYWQRPDLTATTFAPHHGDTPGIRRYRTGDRLAWTPEGRLRFLGRADGQLKLRGFRIEPGEIESLLTTPDGVRDAAVVLHDTEQLVGFVEIEGPKSASATVPSALRTHLEDRLPPYMVPGRLVPLAELPKLPNGKVDRRRLQSMPLPDAATSAAPSAGHDPTTTQSIVDPRQQALLTLWRGLLGREDITMKDHFFQLGGHSLLAVEMAASVRRDLGIPLSPAEVFQHPTLEALCRHLDERQGNDETPYQHLFPLQPGGSKAPLIFAIPHFFSQTFAQRLRGERPVYGLRGVGIRPQGNRGRWPTMAALGQELVDEVLRRFSEERAQRDGFVLAGYSFGASMAVEATRLLESRGVPVHRLLLIAPMALDVARIGPFTLQVDDLRRPVDELSASQALGHFLRRYHPFSRRLYQLLWRRLGVQNKRRMLCLWGDLQKAMGRSLTPEILHADVRLERFRLHRGYRPGVVQAPTLFFNPKEPATDAAATWRPHFGGPFEIVPTPDPHLGPDAVEAARQAILPYLDRLEEA